MLDEDNDFDEPPFDTLLYQWLSMCPVSLRPTRQEKIATIVFEENQQANAKERV